MKDDERMTKRTEELLAYFDRLVEADKHGFHCQREIAEVVSELRKDLAIGIYGKVNVDRETKWAVIQASKVEGATDKDIVTITVYNNELVEDTLEELRKQGYRIFFLYKSVGIIDDFIQK
jgi:hypothetical protein